MNDYGIENLARGQSLREEKALPSRLIARYRIRGDAETIEERARTIAVEQSIEMPPAAVREPSILSDILGEVAAIADRGDGWFDVEIALASATIGDDAGQIERTIMLDHLVQDVGMASAALDHDFTSPL